MKKVIKLVTSLITLLSIVGCNSKAVDNVFGDFAYKGRYLKEYAVEQIDVNTAKSLLSLNKKKQSNYLFNTSGANQENIDTVLSNYGSLVTEVKYYVSSEEEQQVRSDLFQGTDFRYLLDSNHYEPFAQMSVKYIFIDNQILDDMDQVNQEFINSPVSLISPFSTPYTYHSDRRNKLVIQTHSFSELPSSTQGGIGATFRQDCELVFDAEGKIELWQSSLGLYTATPKGTLKEGFIFEVAFNWIEK